MEVLGRISGARALTMDQVTPFLATHDLQPGEFDVLATLRRSGDPYRLTPTALYESLMVSSGGMTSRIDKLEKRGLVERLPHPTDRRGTLVGLTPQGFDKIDAMLPAYTAMQASLMPDLSAEERETLSRLLGKIITGLQASGES